MKTEHPHKTNSSQKLTALLLCIDTVICRVGDMNSENAQVPHLCLYCSGGERSVKCVRSALEMRGKQRRAEGCGSFLGG